MSQEVTSVWRQACAELELQLSPAAYGTWIMANPLTDLEPQPDGSIQAIFTSPTAFHATNLQKNFHELLQSVLEKIIGSPIQLDFRVGATPTAQAAPARPSNRPTHMMVAPQVAQQPISTVPAMPTETPSSVIGQKYTQFHPQTTVSPRVEDLFSPNTIQANTINQAEHSARKAGLRPDYTFTTFAVSTTNEMAHAAATAVSNSPGQAYNPLFLYGGVGVGKTHLMHAIGNNILYKNPLANVLYLTGEEFTNQIVAAIQTKKAIEFKSKYRIADVLLIDDIQFIAGKTAVQEEFFHTFNAIIKQHSQIVLTSDRPPHEINLIEDRLRSRFEAGLMIDIQQPTFELRTAILLIKAKANRLEIPMDIAQNIASQVDSARRIEGMITKLRSESELKGRAITMELVDELLKGEQPSSHEKLRVAPVDVLRAVANHYHIKQVALKGQRRVKSIVTARHIAMYLLKHELEMPYTEIGRWFANRDHTSAMHAVGKIEKLLTIDQQTRQDVSALRMNLLALAK